MRMEELMRVDVAAVLLAGLCLTLAIRERATRGDRIRERVLAAVRAERIRARSKYQEQMATVTGELRQLRLVPPSEAPPQVEQEILMALRRELARARQMLDLCDAPDPVLILLADRGPLDVGTLARYLGEPVDEIRARCLRLAHVADRLERRGRSSSGHDVWALADRSVSRRVAR